MGPMRDDGEPEQHGGGQLGADGVARATPAPTSSARSLEHLRMHFDARHRPDRLGVALMSRRPTAEVPISTSLRPMRSGGTLSSRMSLAET